MKISVMFRREGKTTRVIHECQKTGAVLVVRNARMKREIVEQGRLPVHQVITFDEFRRGPDRLRGTSYPTRYGLPELVVDDADSLLQDLASFGTIRHVTMSKPFTKSYCLKKGYPLDMVGRT